MQCYSKRCFAWFFWCGLLAACSAGCGGRSAKANRYTPRLETARAALEAALTAWQQGGRPGQVQAASPAVNVVDSQWQAGQKLASYQIAAEEAAAEDGSKQFSVRLTFKNPSEEREVRYVVVGQDPIWVFREEDYARLGGM